MTVITKLKLKNFKSFRKAEIPFAKGFTAIAGPNASGKSNILDALLFSMGITSLKLLRASRLTELVNHDASEGYAKVELYIQDKGGKEIEVTRLIDRQGKSIYKLDGKRKTLNEIQSLLLELGINPNGHNIVVQGDITRVIEMNAKQRRQMIEEVAGLQEFEEKKGEALKKLEKVEQRVKDAHLVLGERETYLQELEKEKEDALRYKELQEELKRAKATILEEEIKIIRKELGAARKRLESMGKEIEGKRNDRNGLQEEERELEKKVGEITTRLIEAGQKTYSSFGKEIEQRKGRLGILEEKLRGKNESVENALKRIFELKERIKELRKTRSEREEELKNANDSLDKINGQISMIKVSVDSRAPGFEKRKDEFKRNEARVSELRKELEAAKEKKFETISKKNSLLKDIKVAEASLKELEAARKRLEERAAEKAGLEKKITLLNSSNPAAKLATKERELEEALSGIHSIKGRIESMEESLAVLAKAKADCPTCEKPLEKNRKDEIRGKKESEIASLKEKINGLQEKKERIEAEKQKLRIEEKELSESTHALKHFAGINEELSALKARIAGNREIASAKSLSAMEAGEKKAIENSLSVEKELLNLEAKVIEFRKSQGTIEMSDMMQKMHELNEEKSAKQSVVTRISTEIDAVIGGKTEASEHEIKQLEAQSGEAKKAVQEMEEQKKTGEKELAKIEAEMEKSTRANSLLDEEKQRLTTKITNISEKRDSLGLKAESLEREMNEFNIQQSRNEVRIVDLEEESKDYANIKPFAEFNLNELRKRIPNIEKEVEGLGAINMKALQNFDAYKKEVEDVREKANKLDEERKAVVEMIDKIEVRKFNVFMECFNHVGKKFSELYYTFFNGEGKLGLSDETNPLEGGLLIQAKYKEDTLKSIDAMSGGEKSLTALAFLFAIQSFESAPFYIFDEVDAALDKDNSIKIGALIKGQSAFSQFISISHNDSVINQADQIIGVALNRQKSSVIGLRLRKHAGGAESEKATQEASEA